MTLARPEATAVAQLRANHTPLSHFPHRIGVVDSPNCDTCHQPETTEHFLLTCKAFLPARKTLFTQLRRLKIPRTTQAILTTPSAFHPLAGYIRESKRFEKARQWQPPLASTLPTLSIPALLTPLTQ